MSNVIIILNCIVSVLFTICYGYQILYIFIGLSNKKEKFEAKENHKFGAIICARNESAVIGNLIDSLKNQNYPKDKLDIFVIADNCDEDDDTAKIAREKGAICYERFNKKQVGKGYALDWFFKSLMEAGSYDNYEGFMVFDADNILDPDFVKEMNAVFDNGYRVITSYRNSKNYDDNWLTAGYSLWFLREARFLNNVRMKRKTSCAISGTGFLVSAEIFRENGGWIHHTLTEDIEFTADMISKGEIIGYAGDAVLYDEQPRSLKQSYNQRLRWAKGFYQVFARYGKALFNGMMKGSFSCYDMLMTVLPSMLLTLASMVITLILFVYSLITGGTDYQLFQLIGALAFTFLSFYGMFFALGLITLITEWEMIHAPTKKKIIYLFGFPIYLFTYIPIAIIALFKKVEWKPIKHEVSKDIGDLIKK